MKRAFLMTVAVISMGCNGGGGDPYPCVDVDLACAPLYTPTFDQIFPGTLEGKCGLPGASCHSTEGAQGGLVLDEIEIAHQGLSARVDSADIGCSLVLRRMGAPNVSDAMPPGDRLSDPEMCVFVQWIDAGALR